MGGERKGKKGSLLLSVFVVVDVVHQRYELGDRVVEFHMLVFPLLHALYFHAQRQHPLHVSVVVRGVETVMGLRHVVLDEIPCLGQKLLRHGPAWVLAWLLSSLLLLLLPLLHRRPFRRVRHHVSRFVPR